MGQQQANQGRTMMRGVSHGLRNVPAFVRLLILVGLYVGLLALGTLFRDAKRLSSYISSGDDTESTTQATPSDD